MEPTLENQFKTMHNDHRILSALKQLGRSKFTEIHSQLSCSTRTLTKHLKSLSQHGMITSRGSRYSITDAGIRSIRQLEKELEAFQGYQKAITSLKTSTPLIDLTVEVSRIQPSGHLTVSSFQVSATRVVRLEERQELRRVLSQAIRLISSAIPKETKKYHVLVSGSLR